MLIVGVGLMGSVALFAVTAGQHPLLAVIGVGCVAFCFVLGIALRDARLRLEQDRAEQMKQIEVVQIDEKLTYRGPRYVFRVHRAEHTVSADEFARFEVGDRVKIHRMHHTGIVLQVNDLKS